MFKTNSTWEKKKGRFQSRVLIPPWALLIGFLFINPLYAAPKNPAAIEASCKNNADKKEWCAHLDQNITLPNSNDFSKVEVGKSLTRVLTASNFNSSALFVGTVTLTTAVSSEFKIDSDLCSKVNLPVGGSCQITVTFNPQAVGAKAATVVIPGTDSSTISINMPLTGEGIASPLLTTPTSNSSQVGSSLTRIQAGFDFLETPSDGKTFIDFSSKGGTKVQLMGNPDPLDSISDKLKRVDTIVKRKNEISLVSGGKGIVEIELVALSLKSTSSFDIGFLVGARNSGIKADLYVTVNTLELPDLPPKLTKTSSIGEMVICNQSTITPTSGNVTLAFPDINRLGEGQFASSNQGLEFKNIVSPLMKEIIITPPLTEPCQGGTFESELKVYSDLIFVKPGGDLKNPKDWLFLMPDPTAPISLNGHGEWSNSSELGGFTVLKLEHPPHSPVPLVSLPIPSDLPENVTGIPEIQQVLEEPMSQEIRNILIPEIQQVLEESMSQELENILMNEPVESQGQVYEGPVKYYSKEKEIGYGIPISIMESIFTKQISYGNTLIQPTYLPYRFGASPMSARKREDSQLFDAPSQAFLTTLGESLASFNLSEVTVEINEEMKRLEIPLFSPENTPTAWYSAFTIEPVAVKSEEKSELGLFRKNDGTVYLIFAGNDHQNYESTLLPALDSDIAKAFLEMFPEATLEQSLAGEILFTLANEVQRVRLAYVVTATDFNTSQLSMELKDLNEDGKMDYILSAFGKQQVAFGQ